MVSVGGGGGNMYGECGVFKNSGVPFLDSSSPPKGPYRIVQQTGHNSSPLEMNTHHPS